MYIHTSAYTQTQSLGRQSTLLPSHITVHARAKCYMPAPAPAGSPALPSAPGRWRGRAPRPPPRWPPPCSATMSTPPSTTLLLRRAAPSVGGLDRVCQIRGLIHRFIDVQLAFRMTPVVDQSIIRFPSTAARGQQALLTRLSFWKGHASHSSSAMAARVLLLYMCAWKNAMDERPEGVWGVECEEGSSSGLARSRSILGTTASSPGEQKDRGLHCENGSHGPMHGRAHPHARSTDRARGRPWTSPSSARGVESRGAAFVPRLNLTAITRSPRCHCNWTHPRPCDSNRFDALQ